ncbi:hypothetical protein P20652_2062 [Pseudoalteromonas sp. BSi20652]|nr:hypothetical protein P20652_2062 [Pseudoalteromonas sp. BSi20652]
MDKKFIKPSFVSFKNYKYKNHTKLRLRERNTALVCKL